MKKLLQIVLVLVVILSCLAGCSDEKDNDNISSNNGSNNTSQLTESEFSDTSNTEEVSLNEGEFDPLSIVKDEYIRYDKYSNYYNGGGSAIISFPEDFEVEIVPGLFLKTYRSGLLTNGTVSTRSLEVIHNNQSLGILEYYFVGETLKYNDADKLTEGDIIQLLFAEHDDSEGLYDNLTANGFSMAKIPMYITVPDLGHLFTVEDELTNADLQYIISKADPTSCNAAFETSTYSEKPVAIYKGTINSKTAVGDAVVLQLIYEKTEKYGTGTITKLVSFSTSELVKHDGSSVTWRFKYSDALRFKIDISESEMISYWNENYTWEKLNY